MFCILKKTNSSSLALKTYTYLLNKNIISIKTFKIKIVF